MIGYYVHHVGRGHAERATAIAAHLDDEVTGLSSLPSPTSWRHPWVVLPRDDVDAGGPVEPTAGGRLHWAPVGDRGLRTRMAALAAWIAANDPTVLVSDLSVEVSVLARLLGVRVVTTAIPGVRDDAAHQLGYDVADAIIAPWPDLDPAMCVGLGRHAAKVHHVGGISRFDGRDGAAPTRGDGLQVLVVDGAGGAPETEWHPELPAGWSCVRRGPGRWVDDIWPDLSAADVVVTHCGLGAISDTAAARKPAVLIPRPRPHDEQNRTAAGLAAVGLGVVVTTMPAADRWEPLLARALEQDTSRWSRWSRGDGAARSAEVIMATARRAS